LSEHVNNSRCYGNLHSLQKCKMCPDDSTNPQESCQRFDDVVKFNLIVLLVPVLPVKLRFVTLFENYVSNFPVLFCFFDMLDAEERDSVLRIW